MAVDGADTGAGKGPDTTKEAAEKPPVPHGRRVLIKHILRVVLALAYSPNGTTLALSDEEGRVLFGSLRAIFEAQRAFGGHVVCLAANAMDDLLHNNPHCFRAMDEMGLPIAYINTVKVSRGDCPLKWCWPESTAGIPAWTMGVGCTAIVNALSARASGAREPC